MIGHDLPTVVNRIRMAPNPVLIGVLSGEELIGYELEKRSTWACYRTWSDEAQPGIVESIVDPSVQVECPPWGLSIMADALGQGAQ